MAFDRWTLALTSSIAPLGRSGREIQSSFQQCIKVLDGQTHSITHGRMEIDHSFICSGDLGLGRGLFDLLQVHLKANHDGLLLFVPEKIFLLSVGACKKEVCLLSTVNTALTLIALAQFYSTYKFMAWSQTGNLMAITATEQSATLEVALKNDPWAEYNAACFITKFLTFFLSVDKYHVLRVMDTHHRKELWHQQLTVEAVSMVPHPALPSAVIGTMDGRLLILAMEVPTQSLDLEDLEDLAKAKVSVKFIASICLHGNPIDQIQIDPKTLACVAVSHEEGTVAVVEMKDISSLHYFDEATVEGRLLDVHLQGKQLLVLSSSGGDQETYGDLITLLKLDVKKSSLTVITVFNLAVPSSGLAQSENGKFFFSLVYTTKHLAKFPLSEEEASAPVAPLASVPSSHGLGLHMIQANGNGELALLGRDGRVSLHKPDLSSVPEVFDLQHYQAGGVIDANISASGNILSVSGEGSLALFLRQDPLDVSSELDKATLAALHKMPEIQVLDHFDRFDPF